MNVLIRSDLAGFLGLSAIIGVAVAIALFVIGLLGRPSRCGESDGSLVPSSA